MLKYKISMSHNPKVGHPNFCNPGLGVASPTKTLTARAACIAFTELWFSIRWLSLTLFEYIMIHVMSIDREFVTSAKKSQILTNFPKLKKFVKCPSES